MTINYEAGKRMFPQQKAALTRALQVKDVKERYTAVLAACRKAVREWNGAWPDDWSRWQRAISDVATQYTHETGVFINAPRLEDL